MFHRRDKAILVERDARLLELARCVMLFSVRVGMVALPEARRQFRKSSGGGAGSDAMTLPLAAGRRKAFPIEVALMAINVVPSPPRITWNMFRTVTSIPGTTEEAQINPEMAGLNAIRPERTTGGKFRLPGLALRIALNRSNTMVLKTAAQTDELLAHEQGHFDLMVISARALASELEALETDTVEDLGTLVQEARERHAERVQAIDEAYDRETDHSRNRGGQRKWDTAIVAAKSNPGSAAILGMPL